VIKAPKVEPFPPKLNINPNVSAVIQKEAEM